MMEPKTWNKTTLVQGEDYSRLCGIQQFFSGTQVKGLAIKQQQPYEFGACVALFWE
jgi:hypothetical protein